MELIKDAMSGEMQYLTVEEISGRTGWPTRQHTRYLQVPDHA